MSDPFVDLLESSLEVPDFDLGEMRRAELFAAAMEPVVMPENVLPFPCGDDDEQAAFDWLMGERPADVALMDRLVTQPAFYSAVVAQHGFFRELRTALRMTSVPAADRGVKTPRRTARAVGAVLAAMAASLAAMVATQMIPLKRGGTSAGGALASDNRGPKVADIRVLPGGNAPVSHIEGFTLPFETDPARASASLAPTTAREASPFLMQIPEGVEPVHELREAALAAAREVFGEEAPSFGAVAVGDTPPVEEPALALASRSKTSEGTGREGLYALASDTAGRNNWYYWSDSNIGNGLSVPEPGGCLPVMVGFLLLWWRRRPV